MSKPYTQIQLTKGQFTIIDTNDYDRVSKYNWYAQKSGKSYYALTTIKGKSILLHNFIMGFTPTKFLTGDHINRDKLDNRKENLRTVNKTTQSINQGIRQNNTSGTTGLSYNKRDKCWVASYRIDKIQYHKSFYDGLESNGNEIAKQKCISFLEEIHHTIPVYKKALLIDKYSNKPSYSLSDVEYYNNDKKSLKRSNINSSTKLHNISFRKNAWIVRWTQNGKRKSKLFTIGTPGNETIDKAKENAIAYREKVMNIL